MLAPPLAPTSTLNGNKQDLKNAQLENESCLKPRQKIKDSRQSRVGGSSEGPLPLFGHRLDAPIGERHRAGGRQLVEGMQRIPPRDLTFRFQWERSRNIAMTCI